MPLVSIKIVKGRTRDQKQRLAKAITESVVSILEVPAEGVSVIFQEYEGENLARAGQLNIDQLPPN